ncbi:MAG: hypothetical protein ACE5J9_10365 [Methanosarcinales archaeon]
MKKPLMNLMTPDLWGLLVKFDEAGILNIKEVKRIVKEIANERLEFAKHYLDFAKSLLYKDMQYRNIISRSYYSMYHSARAAVFVQMHLDVHEHRKYEI